MNPDRVQLLRRVTLNDASAVESIMMGGGGPPTILNARCASLVRIVALLSIDSDPSTFEWAVDSGLAAGLEDDAIYDAITLVAPVIGVAKLTSTLPRLMAALDIEVIGD